MSILEIILGVLLIIASIVMIVVIILQEGNQQGVGVVSGGADTFFSKNKARSYDAFLARATKWFAVGFVVIVLALNVFAYFNGKAVETAEDETSVSDAADEESEAADDAAAEEDTSAKEETSAKSETAAATAAAETKAAE